MPGEPRDAGPGGAPSEDGHEIPGDLPPDAWLELAVEADHEAVEAVSEILGRFAGGATSVEPAFELVDEGLSARIDPSRPAIVRAHVPARDTAVLRATVHEAEVALGHLQAFGLRPIGDLRTRVVREAEWADAWKRHFPVLRVGRRIVIRPTWRRHRPTDAELVIALDPGMAFGTGLHPTTRLSLAALERLSDEGGVSGRRVLDVGCGSGILSIAAAKLGAAGVVGVDIDPIAIEATVANARRNHVVRRLRVVRGSVPTGLGPFDVIVANLIAALLVRLAPDLGAELRTGGALVASGIFHDRAREVVDAFAEAGIVTTERSDEGDWVALTAVRHDHANR